MFIMIGAGSGHRKKSLFGSSDLPALREIKSFLPNGTSPAGFTVFCSGCALGQALGNRLFALQGGF